MLFRSRTISSHSIAFQRVFYSIEGEFCLTIPSCTDRRRPHPWLLLLLHTTSFQYHKNSSSTSPLVTSDMKKLSRHPSQLRRRRPENRAFERATSASVSHSQTSTTKEHIFGQIGTGTMSKPSWRTGSWSAKRNLDTWSKVSLSDGPK